MQPSFTKKKRINWGKSPHCDALQKAITDWDNQDGSYFDENGEGITDYKVFATLHGIPSNTFQKYIHPDRNKRRKLGDGFRGKPRALTNDDVKFFGAVFARADRGNDRLSTKDAVDAIIEYVPGLSRDGARQQLARHILPKNAAAGVLKKTLQKVQATTSDRTNINFPQQFRWHSIVSDVYDKMRDQNTGRCKKSNKSFGEVIQHFIVGLDEMCLMSDMHGNLRVIGAAGKTKHEKLLQDSRVSITIVRTGKRDLFDCMDPCPICS